MKTFISISCLLLLIAGLSAFVQQEQPKYTNLKVLSKKISKPELDSTMKNFAQSLGVRCNFCHVHKEEPSRSWDFASDANPNKNMARMMLKMMAKTNKKFFKGEKEEEEGAVKVPMQQLTCFTCHHGKEVPETLATSTDNKHMEPRGFSPAKKDSTAH
jgi:hypothetical protein